MRPRVALSLALLLVAGAAQRAQADPLCMTVDEFNAYFAGGDDAASTLTLQFAVTGVNPADFPNTKGCLAELDDSRCNVGTGMAAANVKVYGVAEPPNASHPPGTLKFEYGTECCPAPPCGEGWADPNPSATVFADGTEQCTVRVWLNPTDYGYHIECGGSSFDAVGDNGEGLMANQVSLLQRNDGGWSMPNATASADEICFEPPVVDPGEPSVTVAPIEDVTASVGSPSSVYPLVGDLSVESGDSEIFLKFDLSTVPGQISKAEILLHLSDQASAEGTGGDACAVADTTWSESSLTWNNRPTCSGLALSRVSPTPTYEWYTWDVSAAVQDPVIYSFAIVPEASDANGSHFYSKEGSVSLAPQLRVDYVPGSGGSGGAGGQGAEAPGPPAAGGNGADPVGPDDPGTESFDDPTDRPTPYGCACLMLGSAHRPAGAGPVLALLASGLVGFSARLRRRARTDLRRGC